MRISLTIALLVFASSTVLSQQITNPDCPPDTSLNIYKVVQKMPIFPCEGCAEEPDYGAAKARADKAMLDFVYSHLKYPETAVEDGAQGMAVVSFYIEPSGCISSAKVVRDVGREDIGQAALDILKAMIEEKVIWLPGRQDEEPVRVVFNLPIKFKLDQYPWKSRNRNAPTEREPEMYLSDDEEIEIGFSYDYEELVLKVYYDSYVKEDVILKLYDWNGVFLKEIPFKLKNRNQEKVLDGKLFIERPSNFKLVNEDGQLLVEGVVLVY
ncbi:energy transducer TonB [Lewinella sp. W8]|uniref:energy transducer TonB n=1 Tax=Lewinella sp. W8 TaxID=2528208 RepID=UPI0010674FA3|nr:energy transducer TonB [Lewinella sp. W8]MTB52604.1 TonB family protein [Lewinella sp. W8]